MSLVENAIAREVFAAPDGKSGSRAGLERWSPV